MKKTSEISYRIAAVDAASPIALLLALYDTLSGDVSRAAEAIRCSDVESRCAQVNHAFLVIGQLQSWIDQDRDPKLAQSLNSFYSHLHAKMLEASIKQSDALMDSLVPLILQVRASWQQRETELGHSHDSLAINQTHSLYQMAPASGTNDGLALSQTA